MTLGIAKVKLNPTAEDSDIKLGVKTITMLGISAVASDVVRMSTIYSTVLLYYTMNSSAGHIHVNLWFHRFK